MDTIATEARNTDLPDLVDMLKAQADVRYDVVVPASGIEMKDGNLVVKGGAAQITDDGVASADAQLVPTAIFDEGVAARFDIPLKYVRTLRSRVEVDVDDYRRGTIYDSNVNYWLLQEPNRRHLVRGFRTDDPDSPGIARALLSDRYKVVDNYDVLMAVLDGVRQTGTDVEIDGADLTDRRMCVRFTCPQVSAYAEDILGSYRSPWNGKTGADNPTVFAGLVAKNSETGTGAFSIVPRLVVQVCSNGLQMTKDAMREVHLGGRLDDGVIRWSDETKRQELELVTSRTRDAVATFLDVDYMKAKIDELRLLAGVEITNPVKTMERLSKKARWSDDEEQSILNHFIKGGDTTALGIAQAVTAFAQTVDAPDRQDELESGALAAAEMAVV